MKTRSEDKPTISDIVSRPETPFSVTSMSPPYPKYRDALIIGVVVVALLGVLLGGYFFTRGVGLTFPELSQKPFRSLTALRDRYKAYQVCESYLRRNEGLFRELGREIRFSVAVEEIRTLDGEKGMTLIFKAQGRTKTRDVIFQLKEEKGEWHILYVGLERRNGQYKTLHPAP